MASFNRVILMGNLTRDPEMRYTPSGAAICQLGLATNRRYTTAAGEQREEACFIDIDVWGKQAESCNTYLRKGSQALVEGRLRFDSWDDKETGKKRSRLTVTAERVQFVGGRQDGGGDGGYSAPQQQQQYQEPPAQQPQHQAPPAPQPQYQAPPQLQTAPQPPQAAPSPLPPFPADAPANPDAGGASDESIDDIPF
jgi:single-strand DNA-binding protein